ncbi:SP_1767 family glycosyltransferase [Exiguobacterium sp. s151]|uniref:SP_1767 family glycosyltransferase n=1 Tax=Exiguobacterium sp. s151 TaxID=2751229 RepID=UPI001BEA2659|nr:SP_1767 family glycosyltransferase [Exiguobacterium sp. s151]
MKIKLKKFLKYLWGLGVLKFYPIKSNILTIDETIEFISIEGNSMVRFGDGEFSLMEGRDLDEYQESSDLLGIELEKVINDVNNPNLLICLPEPIKGVSDYVYMSRWHWIAHIAQNRIRYKEVCNTDVVYGNAFVSRPYMIYKNKELSSQWFEKIISVWKDRDVILVEGEFSRSGVGNDLFSNVKSLKRILCPPHNAFSYYDEIVEAVKKIDKKSLILLSIGPTSKPLAKFLSDQGYWTLDIGHLDSEYEWYRAKVTTKTPLKNKHSAELLDNGITECNDEQYLKSIVTVIGN